MNFISTLKTNIFSISFAVTVFTAFCNAQTDTIDYFGQTPPGNTPVVFAPGIVSISGIIEHSAPAFSPDGNEVFWWVNRTAPNFEDWVCSGMTMRHVGDSWTTPEISPYGGVPVFSVDGKRLYYELLQPACDGKSEGPYFVEKQGDNWSEQKNLGLVTRFPELQFACNVTFANNGTLYFVGYAAGLWNNYGIYRTELINGEYAKPELLPPSINAPGGIRNWTPFIAPDESYLIFSSSRGTSEYDQGDLFVCFRLPDKSWTDAVSLGKPINSGRMERFPAVSPDGKYLFFTRSDPDYDGGVYWVSAEIIDTIKTTATGIQEDKGTGKIMDLRLEQNYPNPFNPSTTIRNTQSKLSQIALTVYDLLGQKIRTLHNGVQNTGEYSIIWDATDNFSNPVSSGIYFYILEMENQNLYKKMVLLR